MNHFYIIKNKRIVISGMVLLVLLLSGCTLKNNKTETASDSMSEGNKEFDDWYGEYHTEKWIRPCKFYVPTPMLEEKWKIEKSKTYSLDGDTFAVFNPFSDDDPAYQDHRYVGTRNYETDILDKPLVEKIQEELIGSIICPDEELAYYDNLDFDLMDYVDNKSLIFHSSDGKISECWVDAGNDEIIVINKLIISLRKKS
ncbi:hypothetical protein [Qiania dongpingensis]|uniref:Uncharacterized protein n=1 Tax=Qiania dongpingensis TaxID=2763669 RepID=A0A7G9G5F2_9FIRM|nr:hypothetical protein [Qiania dongpingensis]QNM06034.1 hypothetical protein H9Q78_02380 [Qiania dongpingensis]